MQNEKYDTVVFIGRLQPPHAGHFHVIKEAYKHVTDGGNIVVLLGSANRSVTIRNPYTPKHRAQMLKAGLKDEGWKFLNEWENITDFDSVRMTYEDGPEVNLRIIGIDDDPYNLNLWIENIQSTIHNNHDFVPQKVALIGHSKDHTSYYLKMFPQWGSIEVGNFKEINSTEVRELLFDVKFGEVKEYVGKGVLKVLADLEKTHGVIEKVRGEAKFVKEYKELWADAPFPPIFTTVDAVILQAGHVLLIERAQNPGKGQFALPGGYIDQYEPIVDSMIREVYEETRLNIPRRVFGSYIKGQPQVFDDPYRSVRGRTITHAFLVDISDNVTYGTSGIKFTSVRGGDDAANAMWVPLADLRPTMMFEDHYFIIREMIRRNG